MRNMFDLNRDGKMSTFEKTVKAAFIHSLFVDEQENESYSEVHVEEVEEEAVMDERREAIKEAGLDSEDYEEYLQEL